MSTSVANAALSKLGEDAITDIIENTRAARACNRVYTNLRKAVLRAHSWNFAIKRVALPLLSTTPVYGYSYQYQLPSDFLKLVDTEFREYLDVQYKLEGEMLLTNESTMNIRYVWDITDVTKFDELFFDTLATRIAAEICIELTQDKVLANAKMEEYKDKLREAKGIDAQDETPDEFITTTWINSRI